MIHSGHATRALIHARCRTGRRGTVTRMPVSSNACAIAVPGHAHIGHGEKRRFTQGRDAGPGAGATGKGRHAHARTVGGLGDERIGLAARLDDHVVGFSNTDLKLVGLDRLHVLAVGLNHGHRQARDADVEIGHRSAVDKAQADPLTWPEKVFEIVFRPVAIDEEGVSCAAQISNIGRHHPHARPHSALLAAHVVVIRPRVLVVVEITFGDLEFLHDLMGSHGRPVGQHDDIVAVVFIWFGLDRVDDQGAVMAKRLLQRMRVPPIGARLADGKLVTIGIARLNRRHAHPGYTVHKEGYEQSVPVNGSAMRTPIEEIDRQVLAFLEAHQGSWDGAIHCHTRSAARASGEGRVSDAHCKMFAGQNVAAAARDRAIETPARPRGHCTGKAKHSDPACTRPQKFTAIDRDHRKLLYERYTLNYAGPGSTPQKFSRRSRNFCRAR